jgi:magnesium chelatase subunit D
LLGGLDLAATLQAGRPVAERGLLAEADGGAIVAPCAERMTAGTAAHLTAAMDTGERILERDGFTHRAPARFGVIALDESTDDEALPHALQDRLSLHAVLDGVGLREAGAFALDPAKVAAARALLPQVAADDEIVAALCEAALALGVVSLRASIAAVRAARAAAASAGRTACSAEDAAMAACLVLAPRATAIPEAAPRDAPNQAESDTVSADDTEEDDTVGPPADVAEVILAAAAAAIPPRLLATLAAAARPIRAGSEGRAGSRKLGLLRGRPAGTIPGEPGNGARLSVIDTLRAAAPWQKLRAGTAAAGRIAVRRSDFRVRRFQQRTRSVTIFVVDASGSAALHRLAETKGAIELLLAECYVRRDQVAVLAFRGQSAALLLPPTTSLTRARRSLAALPGGGGTPLASAIEAAAALADTVTRRGQAPSVVLLTDGRANVASDGTADRARAEDDALTAARGARGLRALLVDTGPRPHPLARRIADAMGARYLPLPHVDAATLSRNVRAATA